MKELEFDEIMEDLASNEQSERGKVQQISDKMTESIENEDEEDARKKDLS